MSLLSCISASSDYQLQELGLQLQLGDTYLQTLDMDYTILSKARLQLSSLPVARSLYLRAKKLAAAEECSYYNDHLDTLFKLKDSVTLESGCRTCYRLLLGCNPGQLSVQLQILYQHLLT